MMQSNECEICHHILSPIMSPTTIRAFPPIGLSALSCDPTKSVNLLVICKRDSVVIEKMLELVKALVNEAPLLPAMAKRSFNFYTEKWIIEHPLQQLPEKKFESFTEFTGSSQCQIDIILSLGGDGTVLYSAWLFQGMHVPLIIPIYLHGTLGFLTVFTFDQVFYCIQEAIFLLTNFPSLPTDTSSTRPLSTNLRMRLRCCIHRQSGEDKPNIESYHVLNELVIDRGPNPFMVNLDIFGNDAFMTNVMADGVVVATPTGSTAYSVIFILQLFI